MALIACAIFTARSTKPRARGMFFLVTALLFPIVGNFLIITTGDPVASYIGSLMYFVGLDWTVLVLLLFSIDYCDLKGAWSTPFKVIVAIMGLDAIQLLANGFTGHAFMLEPIMVEGYPYYSLVPLAGQAVHRVVCYSVFFTSVGIFAFKTITSPRIYKERYAVILASMVFVGAWQTYYIFSGSPVDRSMIGFGVFGLLVFYFVMLYRPVRLLDRMLSRVVSGMNDTVFFFDVDGDCIYANDKARAALGLEPEAPLPRNVTEILGSFLGGWNHRFGETWSDMRQVVFNGKQLYLDVRAQQIEDERGRLVGTSLTMRDATEEEERLQREKQLATHDRLTGLYNKEHLYEKARELLNAYPDVPYKVVGVDIKEFKMINDVYGKEFGDAVLCSLADDMRSMSVPNEAYGRITGDRFGFVIPSSDMNNSSMEERLKRHKLDVANMRQPIIIHMGVYEVEERDLPISIMFDRAFMALASIKNEYQRHVAVYDKGMREDMLWSQRISNELDSAMEEGHIRPYLQPLVDSQGRVEGAEVLVRWIHPEEGFLSPARFIPVFEENGMIAKLDVHMWECACQILKNWERSGCDLFLSVNISPKDFYFIDVYAEIARLVEKYQIDPHKLRLEITETVMMSDLENRLKIIERLRTDGFLVEMDDFGSGYSSLNMLKDIPVDVLKIDMMFLYKTKDQDRAQTILQTIINLSDKLGIPSVTEGVETADQLDMLVNMGCNMFQGYYFAKPMPVEEFESLYQAA